MLPPSFAKNKSVQTQTTTKEVEQPIGELVVKLGDMTIATRSIWAESKSRTQTASDFNDLLRDHPDKAIEMLEAYVAKLSFEVRTQEPQGLSLMDFLKTLES